MYKVISDYITAVISRINTDIAGTAEDLRKNQTGMDEAAAAADEDKSWRLKLTEIERDEFEYEDSYTVKATAEIDFRMYADFEGRYPAVINTYGKLLAKYMKNGSAVNLHMYSDGDWTLSSIKGFNFTGLDNFDEAGDILKTKVEVVFNICG